MYKLKLFIFMVLLLQGCSEILEPVLFKSEKLTKNVTNQEEFDINIDALTFENAREANKDPYPREIMLTGSGNRANIYDEASFLTSNIPDHLNNDDYLLGYGDKLSFTLLNEYKNETAQWPKSSNEFEYILGVGDELTFIQSTDNDIVDNIGVEINETGMIKARKNEDAVIATSGTVGSNGNILLLGIGNLKIQDRTLDNVRTEVRNILIREGLTPNFQLEITKFKSKKAFVTVNGGDGETIPINNIPISLQEVALGSGLSQFSGIPSLITLTRDKLEYRLTSEQLFNSKTPQIFIYDKDIIEIDITQQFAETIIAQVGIKGKILLPEVGVLNASKRTLNDLDNEIQTILTQKRLMPNFQLELIESKSRKVYFVQKNVGSKIISLTNFKVTLKELILTSASFATKSDSLFVVTLRRENKVYRLTLDKILHPETSDIWIKGNDQIEIEQLFYKPGQVFAVSGNGNADILFIDPSKRETLANVIFDRNGALNNFNAKRSEIYLLRGRKPAVAYHLDAQDVSRILVAAKTELRPNDIIYAAERPIISFSRVLAELTPLRILLRDIEDGNIP
jgi:protein involved in polysaccharide export with SLBB domain